MEYEDTWEYEDCLQTSQSPLLKDVYFWCMNLHIIHNNFCLTLANNGFCSWPSIQLTNPEVKLEKQNVNEKAAHPKKRKQNKTPLSYYWWDNCRFRVSPLFQIKSLMFWIVRSFRALSDVLQISHSLLDAKFPFLIWSLKCIMTALTSFVVHGLRFGRQFLLVRPEIRDNKFRLKTKHAEF